VVSGIAFQPVSFTGRIDTAEREARRYTLGDLANDLAATAGIEPMRDFYPLAVIAPLSRLIAAITGDPIPFCAYNCGPVHRTWIERKHAIPIAEWRARSRLAERAADGSDGAGADGAAGPA
jgi:hypothetical protein